MSQLFNNSLMIVSLLFFILYFIGRHLERKIQQKKIEDFTHRHLVTAQYYHMGALASLITAIVFLFCSI